MTQGLAILGRIYPVRYALFEVRMDEDDEEIDSPKPARLISECEVRLADRTRIDLSKIDVTAYKARLLEEDSEKLVEDDGLLGSVKSC